MDVLDVIRRRYSVREYQDKPVEEEKLLRILEAARLAPSARNVQEWRFVVVTRTDLRKSLSEAAYNQSFLAEAPVVIACCSVINDYIMRCGQKANAIDLAIAIDHMSLQAVAEGLGTCWIGSFHPEKVRELLQIPGEVEVIELLALGYPVQKMFINKPRLPLTRIFSENKWEGFLKE